jgi:chloramphenicol 3-O-phosphotransferase
MEVWTTAAWLADTADVMDSLSRLLVGTTSTDELAALRELTPAALARRLVGADDTIAQALHLKLQASAQMPGVPRVHAQRFHRLALSSRS